MTEKPNEQELELAGTLLTVEPVTLKDGTRLLVVQLDVPYDRVIRFLPPTQVPRNQRKKRKAGQPLPKSYCSSSRWWEPTACDGRSPAPWA